MTKPTQAQIDAAAAAMEREMFAPHELPLDDELRGKYLHTAKAALTAAAEAGENGKCVQAHMGGERCVGKCMNPKDCCEMPLRAAAIRAMKEKP